MYGDGDSEEGTRAGKGLSGRMGEPTSIFPLFRAIGALTTAVILRTTTLCIHPSYAPSNCPRGSSTHPYLHWWKQTRVNIGRDVSLRSPERGGCTGTLCLVLSEVKMPLTGKIIETKLTEFQVDPFWISLRTRNKIDQTYHWKTYIQRSSNTLHYLYDLPILPLNKPNNKNIDLLMSLAQSANFCFLIVPSERSVI